MKAFIIFCFVLSIASSELLRAWSAAWDEPVNCIVINSSKDDFAPFWNPYDELLYFNSERSGSSLFYTAVKDSLDFFEPKLLNSELNSRHSNRAYFRAVNPEEAYVSAFRMSSGRSYLNIFKTKYQRNSWVAPFPVVELATDSFTAQATISNDGEMMIFSSSRDNSNNETDLWMSFIDLDGEWGDPLRIDDISSPGNEITPYLLGNDTLFFASDGLGGPGGFDIFMSVRSLGKWSRPIPVSELNTEFNESDFVMVNNTQALFASDRPGGMGGLDIYCVPRKFEQVISQKESNIEVNISASVLKLDLVNYSNFSLIDIPEKIDEDILNKNFRIDSLLFHDKTGNVPATPYFELTADSIYLSPTGIAVRVAIRPEEEISKWTCTILGNNIFMENVIGNDPSKEIIFELNQFKRILANSDSLQIAVEVIAVNGDIYNKKMIIDINRSYVKSPAFTKEDGIDVEHFYFWKDNPEPAEALLKAVAQSASYSRGIELIYFNDPGKAKALGEVIKKNLESQTLTVKLGVYNKALPFSKALSEEILILKVRKL